MAKETDEKIYPEGERFLFSMNSRQFHAGTVKTSSDRELVLVDAVWCFPERSIQPLITEGICPKDTLFHPKIIIGREHITSAIPVQINK